MRFSDLARSLPRASRDTLAETLLELQRAGVIEHAPFHPDYRLTSSGSLLGDAAIDAAAAVTDPETTRVALKKWPMLALVAIGRGAQRFNDVKTALPGLTSGALAPTLKDLEGAGLVTRVVSEAYPPGVSYRLTPEGEQLFPPMDRLIRAAAAAAAT